MQTTALDRAIAALDAAHDGDPARRVHQGRERPAERVWCDTVAMWVARLVADPSPALRLAAHAQHLERWRDPRSGWPPGRAGYLRWRASRQRAHAERAAEILAKAGCEPELVGRVQALIRKERLKDDPEAAALEDAACLAFLELDLSDFAGRHPRDDVLRILGRTWRKMSPAGRDVARTLSLSPQAASLVREALQDD